VASLGIFNWKPAVNIAGGGEPLPVTALQMDRGLLSTLGVRLAYGRNFTEQEDRPHGPPAVILYHGFWLRRFGGNPAVVGQTLQVEGVAHTIVGVLPAGFDLGRAAIALPTAFPAHTTDDGTNYVAVARLAPGATPQAVGTEVQARLHAFYADQGLKPADYWYAARFGAQDFGAEEHQAQRSTSLMWLACAALLLLIALVNLTNLMLLRTLGRGHDASIRGALGAPPWRIALPALAEGVLVGIGGVLAGQGLAALGLLAVRTGMPADWMADDWLRPGALELGRDAWLVAIGVGLFGAVLATLLGLWRSRAALSMDSLREGGRSGLSRRSGLLGRALVVAQVALAALLLCTAGVFLHTLLDNARIDLGFDARGVLTFELSPVKAAYPDVASVEALSQRLVERLRRIPGAARATVTTNLPAGTFSGQFNMGGLHLPGGDEFNEQLRGVDPDYFGVFGIRLLRGRGFERTDVHGGEPVAVVNQKFADIHYGGHALGQTIQQFEGAGMASFRIVGVAANTWQFGPEDPESVRPILFLPLAQMPEDDLRVFRSFYPLRFALKVQGDPDGYRAAVRQAVAEIAPDQPIDHVYSMAYVVHDTTTDTEFNLMLVGLFGALALLLAGVGMYAVMAVVVAAREREFGVRAALGAAPRGLLLLVLRAGLWQIALGLLAGVLLGLAGSSVLRAVVAQLGRSVIDPAAIAAAVLVLALAGLLACLLPALRAGRAAPMRALKGE
jgi:predicted permease